MMADDMEAQLSEARNSKDLDVSEAKETRLKRLRMRSWRRGTKEMDMILGPFSDHGLADLSDGDLGCYEQMLAENDHDLYQWFSAQSPAPAQFEPLISKISTSLGVKR